MTAPAAFAGETVARYEALTSLVYTAHILGLPLPDRLVVWITEPDDAAEAIIREYAAKLDGRVTYRLINDARRIGLEVNAGGAVYRVIKVRDCYVPEVQS
jgi:hypothetical protein